MRAPVLPDKSADPHIGWRIRCPHLIQLQVDAKTSHVNDLKGSYVAGCVRRSLAERTPPAGKRGNSHLVNTHQYRLDYCELHCSTPISSGPLRALHASPLAICFEAIKRQEIHTTMTLPTRKQISTHRAQQ